MQWEAIKAKCIKQALNRLSKTDTDGSLIINGFEKLISGERMSQRQIKTEVINEIVSTIDNWDIRQWEGLRRVFPKGCFPSVNNLSVELTDNGWLLI